MDQKVRVRFAPSPTGGLHLGGVRTVLYNYLFAKQHRGEFIVRIEDTDQSRYVAGAEEYIYQCLKWCGLEPDESPIHGGDFGPYRQSERKELYIKYAEELFERGHAYLAFDTPEELEQMRLNLKSDVNPSPQYDNSIREKMKNSLSLSKEETESLKLKGTPYVVRIKMPTDEVISFKDMIHGEVSFESKFVDDKVLLKADGMPTYHLAVVVDDYLMQISHAFRGEEWLSSAPVHIQLWKWLFGIENMPQWAHLPLILGPKGKLSKRDGAAFGFPVFAMNWKDPATGELINGFKETGFLPEAFINLLAVLGWNDGSDKEIFSRQELLARFSMERVHKSGAKFDFEKARWFNHEWIKASAAVELAPFVQAVLRENDIDIDNSATLVPYIDLVKERCSLVTDFFEQTAYFFRPPDNLDMASVKPKWTDDKADFFNSFIEQLGEVEYWNAGELERAFKKLAAEKKMKAGELQLPFRIMLVGGKFGPAIFEIVSLIGRTETISRIQKALSIFSA